MKKLFQAISAWFIGLKPAERFKAIAGALFTIIVVLVFLQLAFCSTPVKASEPGDFMKFTAPEYTYVGAGGGTTGALVMAGHVADMGTMKFAIEGYGGDNLAGAHALFEQRVIRKGWPRFLVGFGVASDTVNPMLVTGFNIKHLICRIRIYNKSHSRISYNHHDRPYKDYYNTGGSDVYIGLVYPVGATH